MAAAGVGPERFPDGDSLYEGLKACPNPRTYKLVLENEGAVGFFRIVPRESSALSEMDEAVITAADGVLRREVSDPAKLEHALELLKAFKVQKRRGEESQAVRPLKSALRRSPATSEEPSPVAGEGAAAAAAAAAAPRVVRFDETVRARLIREELMAEETVDLPLAAAPEPTVPLKVIELAATFDTIAARRPDWALMRPFLRKALMKLQTYPGPVRVVDAIAGYKDAIVSSTINKWKAQPSWPGDEHEEACRANLNLFWGPVDPLMVEVFQELFGS